jgi:2-amino-4-hydroxy-6-hydroxymethyldihydropteridine diphosphokinase
LRRPSASVATGRRVPETVFIGLGSNIGDRLASLQRAVDLLQDEPHLKVVASSRVWESDPVGGPAQPDFLNAVIRILTTLSPRDLLAACHRVESVLGRTREVRWGPRTIDVDLLLYDELDMDEPDLIVPHPRITERAFVLLPLLELDPEVGSPDGTLLTEVRLGPHAAVGAHPYAPPLRLGRAD